MSSIQRMCSIEDCNRPFTARNYCKMHYLRFWKYGDPSIVKFTGTHGLSHENIYRVWATMKDRCHNPNNIGYHNYGGRGITVCDRWRKSFKAFYDDMGDRPTPKHSIDRIDNNKGYSPDNCRWVTGCIQNWNKRIRKVNTSGYIGVFKNGYNGWMAMIRYQDNGRYAQMYLGTYKTKEEAAIEYDKAAIFFRGEYAVTNIL